MDTTTIPVDLGRIAQDLQIRRVQVESVVQLLDEGNTVPFITRYRKERTGNLNEVTIREIQSRVGRLRELAERKETILKSIEAQGKLSDELAEAIRGADSPKRLEDLYLPYKPKKKTKASDARDKGLEPLALRIWNRDETLTDLAAAASEMINPEKELETPEKVLEGVGHILAEAVSELANVREAVRRAVWKAGKIVTTKAENLPEAQGLEYRDYFQYSEPLGHIPPHRVLAINRGDKEGPLKVKLEVPRPELERALFGQLPLEGHPHADFFAHSALDALDRLLLPSLDREVRRDLTEMAERHAVDVFARNLRSLLLQPPIRNQTVLAIDPGFRTGCKVAVLDGHGVMLEQGVIHPHQPQNKRYEAKNVLKDLVGKHNVSVVAIGNGTACRETEELVAEIIAEGTHFQQNPDVPFPGASFIPGPPVEEPASIEKTPESAASADSTPTESAPETLAVTEPEIIGLIEPEPEPEPAAEPEPEPEPEHAAHSEGTNGSSPVVEETAVESVPPISGGAPVDDETIAEAESEPVATTATEEPVAPEHPASDEPVVAEAKPEEPMVSPPVAEEPEPVVAETATSTETEAPVAAVDDGVAKPAAASMASPPKSGPKHGAKGPSVEFTRPPKPPKGDQPPKPPRPKMPPPIPKPHPSDALLTLLSYVIVNEAGASVYSASPIGREEFPELDATTRGTISIGRRLQDPLAELVKIEPQNIGVGLYQHDVNPKQLKESLETVIESCVNFVGVDLNTASIPLLRHVSGLNQLTARRLVERRLEKGPFTDLEQVKDVEGIGPATFTQAAGFLKIPGAANPLDKTWVHPESYGIATKLLEKLGFGTDLLNHKEQLPALHEKLDAADIAALSQELEVGEPTLRDIFDALARPDRDPREDLPKPIFKKGVLKLEDLTPAMELKGTVLNVVDFGAFVDIGLKDSGLVHISQLANRYIKSPHDVVSVGDVVTVWVMGVDGERKRVSLTMVKPGTERPRTDPRERGGRRGGEGQQSGERQGPGRSQGAPQGQGDRRGGGGGPRPPRRDGGPGSSQQQPSGDGGQATRQQEPAPRANLRIPGPPQRAQGGDRRGGSRPGGGGGGGSDRSARFQRAQVPAPPPPGPAKPAKPAPPPPPLSKDALTGSVPLRTFGQLKQLFEARVKGPDEDDTPGADSTPHSESANPPQQEPSAEPQPSSDQSAN